MNFYSENRKKKTNSETKDTNEEKAIRSTYVISVILDMMFNTHINVSFLFLRFTCQYSRCTPLKYTFFDCVSVCAFGALQLSLCDMCLFCVCMNIFLFVSSSSLSASSESAFWSFVHVFLTGSVVLYVCHSSPWSVKIKMFEMKFFASSSLSNVVFFWFRWWIRFAIPAC